MLLDERNLRLNSQLDVRQRARARAGGDAGQNPRGTLLVHEPTRPIDRIDDDRPRRGAARAGRHDDPAAGQPLGDEQDGGVRRRNRAPDLLDEHMLGDAIDRIDRVPVLVASHAGQRACRGLLARVHDVPADPPMQGLNRREERMGDGHDDGAR